MPQLLPAAFVALWLVSTTAAAQADSRESMEGGRFIELAEEPGGEAPEVLIRPGGSTNFNFDAELLRTPAGASTVRLDKAEHFKLVDVGLSSLRLLPSDTLKPGDRLSLQVYFRDGAAPAFARFTLVVSAARAERVVEVYRDARPVESYRQETREAHAATAKCLDALEQARAERAGPGGLLGLLVSRQVDEAGVRIRDLANSVTVGPGSTLAPLSARTYRSATQVVVQVVVAGFAGTRPWTVEGASLTGRRRPEPHMLTVWQEARIAEKPDLPQRIIVVADAAPDELQGTYTLKLRDSGTDRTFVLNNVTFP